MSVSETVMRMVEPYHISAQITAASAAHSSATSAPSANHMETRWIGQAASAIRNTTSSTSQKKAADFML